MPSSDSSNLISPPQRCREGLRFGQRGRAGARRVRLMEAGKRRVGCVSRVFGTWPLVLWGIIGGSKEFEDQVPG